MDIDQPIKRRKMEGLNDVSSEPGPVVQQASLSVKPDKILKLRKIVAASCEKIQSPKLDEEDIVMSSVGSTPCSSPPEHRLKTLCAPLNTAELQEKLTGLKKKVASQVKTASAQSTPGDTGSSPSLQDTNNPSESPGSLPLNNDDFKALVKNLINEKMRKLEESYAENIIPDLEKKITQLENENKHLEEQTKLLQKNLTVLLSSVLNKPQLRTISTQTNIETETNPVSFTNQSAVVPNTGNQPILVGTRYPIVTHGGTFTTMAGQPRLFNAAQTRPSLPSNSVVQTKTYQSFHHQNTPATAAVYPQTHNTPVSPTNHQTIPQQSPPARNPGQPGYKYPQQPTNSIVIRAGTGNQVTMYHSNTDLRAQTLQVNPQMPASRQHGPNASPPVYQTTKIRHQHYRPGTMQVNAVQQYGPRAGTIAQTRTVTPSMPSGHRHHVPPNPRAGYPRTGVPPPLVRTQTTQQLTHITRASIPLQNTPNRDQAPEMRPPPPVSQASSQPPVASGPPRGLLPPSPDVTISSVGNGIVLSWNMVIPEGCAQIDSYQLFAYQKNGNLPHSPSLWKKLGIVKALPLPMACTLTQFVSGSCYYFAVRAIDIYGRAGKYSQQRSITLPEKVQA